MSWQLLPLSISFVGRHRLGRLVTTWTVELIGSCVDAVDQRKSFNRPCQGISPVMEGPRDTRDRQTAQMPTVRFTQASGIHRTIQASRRLSQPIRMATPNRPSSTAKAWRTRSMRAITQSRTRLNPLREA